VVALITGFLMLGDKLAPIQVLACAVIFGGVALGQLQGSGRDAPESAPAVGALPTVSGQS
jgi:drug/metabolite transporter (DMT)-like permease